MKANKPAASKRRFLNSLAAIAGASMLSPSAIAKSSNESSSSANKAYRVSLIGCGWYGKSDLFKLIQVADVNVVGICDVDKHFLEETAVLVAQRQKNAQRPSMYTDYKKMLSETNSDIVIIGTPDHWHALQCIDAIKAGAHVFLQKPISVDVLEGEAILAAAKLTDSVVQIGMQRRMTPHLLNAKKEIVDSGKLGNISHVEMWCYFPMRANRNPPLQEVPDFFDYEAWAGPAPKRPYDGLPHKMWWRAFMEYSNGVSGDMCVHMYDTVRWLLGLGWPKRVSSTGGIYVQTESKANTPDTQNIVFEHDNLNCIWQHRTWGVPPNPDYPWAFALYGDKGTLVGSTMQADFTPVDKDAKAVHFDLVYEKEKYPKDMLEEDIEHNAAPATRLLLLDFIHAIETKRSPVSDLEQGHISTASCILANMSMNLGRPLSYDPINKIVVNDEEATSLLARKYRTGYIHPYKPT
ncbi:Gfo/Idh/MocA family protein [Ningiella sp. W23]|uniref:Gfo/Idh/MocA family protein n=1 Tax=Ningiella sp. W23 TaxID=3023715 RepID=UPI003757F500